MLTGCRREEARAIKWAHEVPLNQTAAEIISSMRRRGPFVFTIVGEHPMTVHQIKARLDRETGTKDWRLHDLSRTLRSGLAEIGVNYEIAERTIGHAMPQLERTYNVFAYRDEKRSALERWARHLNVIVTDGRAAPNVVELRSGT
jgi:integrase